MTGRAGWAGVRLSRGYGGDDVSFAQLLGLPGVVGAGWVSDAVCGQTNPDAFYPEKGGPVHAAKAVCASCPVTEQCLQYALEHNERFGVWGGTSERERREMRRLAARSPRTAPRTAPRRGRRHDRVAQDR